MLAEALSASSVLAEAPSACSVLAGSLSASFVLAEALFACSVLLEALSVRSVSTCSMPVPLDAVEHLAVDHRSVSACSTLAEALSSCSLQASIDCVLPCFTMQLKRLGCTSCTESRLRQVEMLQKDVAKLQDELKKEHTRKMLAESYVKQLESQLRRYKDASLTRKYHFAHDNGVLDSSTSAGLLTKVRTTLLQAASVILDTTRGCWTL